MAGLPCKCVALANILLFPVVADSERIWNVLLHVSYYVKLVGFWFIFYARVDVAAFSLPNLVNFMASRIYCTSCCLYMPMRPIAWFFTWLMNVYLRVVSNITPHTSLSLSLSLSLFSMPVVLGAQI